MSKRRKASSSSHPAQEQETKDVPDLRETVECEVFVSDPNVEFPPPLLELSLREAQKPNQSDYQAVAHFVQVFSMILKGDNITSNLNKIIERHNIKLVKVYLPSQAKERSIRMDNLTGIDAKQVLVILGMMTLFLFRNLSRHNFQRYCATRINAINGVIGRWLLPNADNTNLFTLDGAWVINRMLGCDIDFKQTILRWIVKASNELNGVECLCRYLHSMLEWKGMEEVVMINETLIITESPILLDPRLKGEVCALHEIFTAICTARMPQFYPFFEGSKGVSKIMRNRFKIIIGMADKLKIKDYYVSNLQQFLSQLDTSQQGLVTELVKKHQEIMKNYVSPRQIECFKALCGINLVARIPF